MNSMVKVCIVIFIDVKLKGSSTGVLKYASKLTGVDKTPPENRKKKVYSKAPTTILEEGKKIDVFHHMQ